MRSYIEMEVPLHHRAKWIAQLKHAFHNTDIKVAWKVPGHPHLTLAFMNETPNTVTLAAAVERCLRKTTVPTILFDRLDVFPALSGTKYVINLTTINVPENFQSLVNDVRAVLEENGAVIDSPFRFHVTLGEVYDTKIDMARIEEILRSVTLPLFSLRLNIVNFLEFCGKRTNFANWNYDEMIKNY